MKNEHIPLHIKPDCQPRRLVKRWEMVRKRTWKHYSFFIFHFSFLLSIANGFAQSPASRTPYLLYSQSVRGSRALPADELESLIPQKPNKRILRLPFTPALWWYQWGASDYDRAAEERRLTNIKTAFRQDSTHIAGDSVALNRLTRRYARKLKRQLRRVEEGNSRMRIGEAPSYFLERDALANTAKLQLYLQSKGFFQARARYSVDTLLEGRVRVNYTVAEGIPYLLRSIGYEIADPAVDSLVRLSLPDSPLHKDDRYDADRIRAEAVRIEELLRNKGYYAFSRQYVRAQPDTSVNTPRDTVRRFVELYIQVLNPPGQARHVIYRIGAVEVAVARPDVLDETGQVLASDTVQVNGVAYYLQGHSFATRLLDTKIRLRPGQLFRQRDLTETQRQLFLVNQFKFVNINFIDTARRELRTRIVATPTDKYEYSAEGGLFVLVSQQGYPGPFGNLTFRVRNFFGGLETFETSLRYGLESQIGFAYDVSKNQPLLASELNFSTSLIFPQILLPGRMRMWFDNANPRTQISLGYGNTRRPDFTRSNFRTTLTYSWQPSARKQIAVSLVDLNYLQANIISQQFARQIDSLRDLGSTIRLAYRNAFASDVSATFTYNTNPGGANRRASFLRVAIESGGTTLNLLSGTGVERLRENIRQLTGNDSTFQLYKYLRLNIDYRHYIPLRPHVTLAFRLNTGIVWGYAGNRTAPYEKLFFVGGSNSIRAWPSRRLGPGSAYPYLSDPAKPALNDDNYQFIYRFEQPGNLLVEGSAELRARWFRFGAADVNVAAFIDAGNVWTIDDTGRKGGNFQASRFLTDMAVGTGLGLRFGFSFFILRLDGGIKVWDPARRYIGTDGITVDDRFILPKFSLARLFSSANPLVVQFGIGYPF